MRRTAPREPAVDGPSADASADAVEPTGGTADWPGEWLRGALTLCVLRVLSTEATYGYEIAQRLAAGGLGEIKGGTLYPLLGRLHSAGYVDEEWRPGDGGPGRKYYVLTDAGRSHLADESTRWSRFAAVTCAFLTTPHDTTEVAR